MTNIKQEQPMLQAISISFGYPRGEEEPVTIFENLSLTVPKGQFLAVLGHNGSGKSTLAKHFNAILLPTTGQVLVDGMDTVEDALLWQLRCKVGMVFQNPDNQLVATKVEEDVAFAPENLGVDPAQIRQRVDDALKAVGMYDLRGRAPHQLSGGQKQRVTIAGIIAMRPECIVLDEPTAMLDPRGRLEVMETIAMLRRQFGMTVVLITHYMDEAAAADRVAVMDDGRIILDGTPQEVFAQIETLRRVGLDVPQTVALADLLTKGGLPMPKGLLTREEFVSAFTKALPPVQSAPDADTPAEGEAACVAACTPLVTADTPVPENAAIALRGVSYTYSGGSAELTHALCDISMNLQNGTFTGLIGHTGSGKSTLVQQLNGLLKPTAGKVFVGGEDIWKNPKELRRFRFAVGLVFQYPEYQLFEETVYKDMAFGPKNMGLPEDEIDRRVRSAAKYVGISDEMLEKSPFDLSGGEKRRAAIGGVLAMEPSVLVLDEPTAGLDPRGREQILGQLQAYQQRSGTTVLLISHSMEDVARYAQQVLVMNEGRIALCGATKQVFGCTAALEEMGLALPQVTRLCATLEQLGYPLEAGMLSPEAAAQAILGLKNKANRN